MIKDFPSRPAGASADSENFLSWIDKLGLRQNIDLLQELTSVASGDELAILDIDETGRNKTKKVTVGNLLLASVPTRPCFLLKMENNVLNVTGNGATYDIVFDTEVFDQGNNCASGVFTAPVAGKYLFGFGLTMAGIAGAMTDIRPTIVHVGGQNANMRTNWTTAPPANPLALSMTTLMEMDAADTAFCRIIVVGGAGDTADVSGGASGLTTYFWGLKVA